MKIEEERIAKIHGYPFNRITNVEGNFTQVYVERREIDGHIYYIRWKFKIGCSDHEISVAGPTIADPDESYFKKFKAGDVALPEPYKSIYDSVRCTEYKMPIVNADDEGEDAKTTKNKATKKQ